MRPQVISLSAAGTTAWIPVDYKQNPYNISLSVVLSDTPTLTYKVEYTLDDIFNSTITPTALTHSTLTGLTANATGSIITPVRAIRLNVTAWTAGTATMTALQSGANPNNSMSFGGIQIRKFPTWPTNTGLLLASLVTSSTASRTSNVVTVLATAHGITTGASFVGFRFYYPGSASLVAGWYDSILTIPDANTITFTAEGTDFGSESINSGAAWITDTDAITMTIPGNTLRDGSRVRVSVLRTGDTSAALKKIFLTFGGSNAAFSAAGAAPTGESALVFRCVGTNKQVGAQSMEGTLSTSSPMAPTKDITVDQALSIKITAASAAAFIALYSAIVEITV